MNKKTPIQEAAEKWASEYKVPFHAGKYTTAAFLAGSRHPISEDLIKRLEDANPYNPDTGHDYDKIRWGAYRVCLFTIKRLINEQSTLTNKEGI